MAQSSLPTFTCDGYPYQFLSNELFKYDPISNSYISQGPTNSPGLNGAGFNRLDNYAYALGNGNLYRVGSDGTRERVSTGDGGAANHIGTMDFGDNFYGIKGSNRRLLIRIDVAASEVAGTTQFTEVTFTGVRPPRVADNVYVQNGTDEYVIVAKSNQIYFYNFQTGEIDQKTALVPAGAPTFKFGAVWTDATGRIWAFHNDTGDIYELRDPYTASPYWVLLADLSPSGNNDGFSCSRETFPTLPPIAQDDDFITTIDTAFNGNVTDDNGNGTDEDPEGVQLAVLWSDPGSTTPTNGTLSNTTLTGGFTYTPNSGTYGTDSFDYVVSDGGFTDTATVTITIPVDNSDLLPAYPEALHNVVAGHHLGAGVTLDSSPNSNSSANADGDIDDAVIVPNLFVFNTIQTITVDVTEPVAGSSFLQAWIDWNADDDFSDIDEQVAVNLTDADDNNEISFNVTVPPNITSGDSFLRVRWSTQSGLNVADTAPDGEVEDYKITLAANPSISGVKSVSVWDPVSAGLYAVPGNDVIYTITVTNDGDVPLDEATLFLVDEIPNAVTFYNGDIDDTGPETGPVVFSQSTSAGLSFSTATDIGYSSAVLKPTDMSECNYTPVSGYDPDVNFICFSPDGQFQPGTPDPEFTVSFRTRIN